MKAIERQRDTLKKEKKRLEDKIEEIQRDSEEITLNSPDHVHVGFLHASPIFYMHKDEEGKKQYEKLPEKLEVKVECEIIKSVLKDTKKAIRF